MRKYYTTDVIKRALTEAEFAEFNAKYDAVPRTGGGAPKKASDEDKQILADYMGGMTVKELRAKYKCSESKVNSGVLRALKA